ncbi:pentapeptide repeat-containing protein [Haloplanus natans]|uniref:pentapeptide repeat-containing protein n=1 Tax=Haloplanus natans TaxID=376171 RepID=UPI000677EAF1|nr:pentapeptide repeat-containing protein [Haloplanus natans]
MLGDSPTDRSVKTCTVTSGDLPISRAAIKDFDLESWRCSRPVWESETAEFERCVWHADTTDKPKTELVKTIENGDLHGAVARRSDLTSISFPEDVGLVAADLSGVNLEDANLPRADLDDADLSGGNITDADLSGADLENTDLSGATLEDADLSGANLTAADLRRAYLHNTALADATLARNTRIDAPSEQLLRDLTDTDVSEQQQYDRIARVNHELRVAYSANGLTGRARTARVRERKARRREARAEGGRGWLAYLWSCGSQLFTGYGIQLRWIATMMVVLWLLSAAVYWDSGMAPRRSLYYSIVTFTTSPPDTPPSGFATAVAGFETFAGTAAIVFLGYVLGTREQV